MKITLAEIEYIRACRATDLAAAGDDADELARARKAEDEAHARLLALTKQNKETKSGS